jgi:hypothetical protein
MTKKLEFFRLASLAESPVSLTPPGTHEDKTTGSGFLPQLSYECQKPPSAELKGSSSQIPGLPKYI